jgi:hypothetical protein
MGKQIYIFFLNKEQAGYFWAQKLVKAIDISTRFGKELAVLLPV